MSGAAWPRLGQEHGDGPRRVGNPPGAHGEPASTGRRRRRPNGLALGRFSVIYATPPCVITPKSPVQGSRAVQEPFA